MKPTQLLYEAEHLAKLQLGPIPIPTSSSSWHSR